MNYYSFLIILFSLGLFTTTYGAMPYGDNTLIDTDSISVNTTDAEFEKSSGSTVFISDSDRGTTSIKQIVLIRHGEPDIVKTGKFSRRQAREFLISYDTVGIVIPEEREYFFHEPHKIKVFASPLNRALTTAKFLFGEEKEFSISDDFREFERTIGNFSPELRLPIKTWTTFARIKWVLGADRQGIESFKDAKLRARKVAEQLIAASEKNDRVALVAHGFLNRYVKKELENMGWELVQDGGHGYLSTNLLVKRSS